MDVLDEYSVVNGNVCSAESAVDGAVKYVGKVCLDGSDGRGGRAAVDGGCHAAGVKVQGVFSGVCDS